MTTPGPEHPDTATDLNNLALLLLYQGDLAAARPLYERALAIREKVLGAEQPEEELRAPSDAEEGIGDRGRVHAVQG